MSCSAAQPGRLRGSWPPPCWWCCSSSCREACERRMATNSDAVPDKMASFDLLIGTYTDARVPAPGDGLYAARCRDGVIGDVRLLQRTPNPSWLTFDPERSVAYCVSELADGALAAAAVTPGDGV